MQLVINAFVISLIVLFIKATTWKGHVFEEVDKFFKSILTPDGHEEPVKIYKPIIGCHMCMTPWHGLYLYFVLHFTNIQGFEDIRFQTILFTLLLAGGFAALYMVIMKIQENIQDINENFYS